MLTEHSFAARTQQHGSHRRGEARTWQETPAQQSRGSGSKGPWSTMIATMQAEPLDAPHEALKSIDCLSQARTSETRLKH